MKTHNANQLKFDRRSGAAPVVVLNFTPGQPIPPGSIAHARSVTLRYQGERVLVNNAQPQVNGTYLGNIYGFEPSVGVRFKELGLEDRVLFEEHHVFGLND